MKIILKKVSLVFLSIAVLMGMSNAYLMPVKAVSQTVDPAISIGNGFAVALKADGTLLSWGVNSSGQLGNGAVSSTTQATPIAVEMPSGITFKAVSAGYDHVLALDTNGGVWSWGANGYGQLGLENVELDEYVSTPTQITALSGVTVLSVSAGQTFSLAHGSDGVVYAWGNNASQRLGIASANTPNGYTATPTSVDGLSGIYVKSVVAGLTGASAITAEGALWVWGDNQYNRLGLTENTDDFLPTQRSATNLNFSTVAHGVDHTVVLASDGTVRSFGLNKYGQFGNGTQEASIGNGAIRNIASIDDGVAVLDIAAGSYHTLVLADNGTVYSFGYNNVSQLGISSAEQLQVTSPKTITFDAETVPVAVAAAYNNSAVIDENGFVWMWGDNTYGQVGDNTLIERSSPTQVVGVGGNGMLNLGVGSEDVVQDVYITATATIPAPTYAISIPATIDFGELNQKLETSSDRYAYADLPVSVSGVDYLFGEKQIVIKLSAPNGEFELIDGNYALPYDVYRSKTDTQAIVSGEELVVFTANGAFTGYLRFDQSLITRSGSYTGTVMFEVSVESIE